MYDFKNSFFPNFLLIHRAKYIFSRVMFCLYHFRAKIHGVSSELAFLQMNVYGLQMKFILYNKTVYSNFLLHEEFDIAHKITMQCIKSEKAKCSLYRRIKQDSQQYFQQKKRFCKNFRPHSLSSIFINETQVNDCNKTGNTILLLWCQPSIDKMIHARILGNANFHDE